MMEEPRTSSGTEEDIQDQQRSPDAMALSNYLSPPEERSSLLGALGGGGNPLAGSALLPMLLMSQMQQQRQPSYADPFLNAFYGAKGMANPNPTPQPQAPSQYQQFEMIHSVLKDQALEKERTARLGLAQQASERLQAAAEKTAEQRVVENTRKAGEFGFLQSLNMMKSDNRALRDLGAPNFLAAMGKLGMQTGDNDAAVIKALATGDMDNKAFNENLQDLANGVPPDVILTRKGMTPEILAAIQQPGGAVELLAKDKAVDRRKKAADASNAEATLIEHQNPEFFKASPDAIGYIQAAARAKFGTTYDKLPDDEKPLAFKSGMLDANAAKLEEYKKQQQILYGKQAQLAQLQGNIQIGVAQAEGRGIFQPIFMDKNNIWVDRTTGRPAQGNDLYATAQDAATKKNLIPLSPKQVDVQNGLQRAWVELENLKKTHDKMVDGNLYSGSGNWPTKGPLGAISAPVENLYKGTIAPKIAPTDSDRAILRNFDSQKTALINIDRTLGTLGVRAFGAFEPQLGTISPTTGRQGVELTISQLEDALRAQGRIDKLPGVVEPKERIWTPPTLGKGQTPPPSAATAAPDIQLPPVSRSTVETFKARALAKYPPGDAMQKISEFLQMHRIVD